MNYVTISIDDGYLSDWQTAEILEKYGFTATFYFPQAIKDGNHRGCMSHKRMREFHACYPRMEIGQHGFNHLFLTRYDRQVWQDDILKGYKWHKDTFGEKPKMFAYPRGYLTQEIADFVKQVGYIGARTVKLYKLTDERYAIPGGAQIGQDLKYYLSPMQLFWTHSWNLNFVEFEQLISNLKNIGYTSITNSEYVQRRFNRS